MERIIAIKNIIIEIKRNILHIINNRAKEIEINVFTGYKSETAIELDNLNNKYYALLDELQEACLYDSTIYSGIVNSINKEAELIPTDRTSREIQRRSNQRMVTALKSLRGEGGIASTEAAKAEIETELIAIKNIMTLGDTELKSASKAPLLTIEDLEEVETLKKIRREESKLETIIKEVNFYIEMSKKPAMQDHIREINNELLKRKKMLIEQQTIIEQLAKSTEPKQETVEKPVEAATQVAVKAEEAIIAPKEDTTVSENKEETTTQVAAKEVTTASKEDAEFWDLVDKTTTDKRMDLVDEVWGDLSSLYKEATTPDNKEIIIGEDEYIDINKLTYESQEIWKPIKHTLYEVSTKGRVRIAGTKKEVKDVTVASGVKIIFLNGRWMSLAKLIYAMFIEGGVKEVIHIDKDIHNNHILNLKAV